jgi:hypothetical protein
MHGRGVLTDPLRMDKEAADLVAAMADDAYGIANKKLADHVRKLHPKLAHRVGHWNRDEVQHNRWKAGKRLVLWGYDMPSSDVQQMMYAAARASMAKQGVVWEEWDGSSTQGQDITMPEGCVIHYSSWLPDCQDAKDWLIDFVSNKMAQAIGRLRLTRRVEEEGLSVEIHTAFPVMGFGIKVDERIISTQTRVFSTARQETAVAAAVVNFNDAVTLNQIVQFCIRAGVAVSRDKARSVVADLKARAFSIGSTLSDVATTAVAGAEYLLSRNAPEVALHKAAGTSPEILVRLFIDGERVLPPRTRTEERQRKQRAGP